mmetsp:Transcript_8724/g.26110  ORF Transcript_8724/g.26110 Transcript_8724/m.26110 type:complete len:205 (-) Transcript_8724:630-1244(-)|eukprot:CAMPEP_0113529186 /NCGR_PEP_ID=MMETSP0015_2-20120614/2256_1 /TAXON_ID=2838 /ORGANISM="Odontella" /LENGTH=204 /DNA_ID=CAMNT_0000427793 /DNA_START=72 /DNA_END=686 /DNA_ORIENTATION=+ /assembly_acc=CAM_ASM_000160
MGHFPCSLHCLIPGIVVAPIVVARNVAPVTSSAFLLQKYEPKLYSLSPNPLICLSAEDAGDGHARKNGESQWTDDDDWSQLSSYGRRSRDDSLPEDKDLYRIFQGRVDEPGIGARSQTSVEEAEQRRGIRETMSGSLDFLALAVGLFFLVTAVLSGGSLFATSPSSTASSSRVVDADALLREDFDRAGMSVYFSSDSESIKRND